MLAVSHIPKAIKDQGSRLGMLIWPGFWSHLLEGELPIWRQHCSRKLCQGVVCSKNCRQLQLLSYQHHHHHLHPSSTFHLHHLHHLHHLRYHHHFHHHLHPSSTSSTWLTSSRSFTWYIYSTRFYISPMWSSSFNHPLMYRHVGFQLVWAPFALEMTYNVLYIYNRHIYYIYIYIRIYKYILSLLLFFMFHLNIIYAGADTQVISFYELLQDSYETPALFSSSFTSSTPRTCKWSTSLSSYKTMRKDLQRQLL